MGSEQTAVRPGEILRRARIDGRSALNEPEAKRLLRAAGIAVPDGRFVAGTAEAGRATKQLAPPYAVKVVGRRLTHKSDVGGVALRLASPPEVRKACDDIARRMSERGLEAEVEGFLVETFRPAPIECLLGLRCDDAFGPVVAFGLGGVLVEAVGRVAFRLAPLRDRDVEALLHESGVLRLIRGYRGTPAIDPAGVMQTIAAFAGFAAAPEIAAELCELEINPLAVGASGCLALDAVAVLRPPNREAACAT